jgi:hypothetical protein
MYFPFRTDVCNWQLACLNSLIVEGFVMPIGFPDGKGRLLVVFPNLAALKKRFVLIQTYS